MSNLIRVRTFDNQEHARVSVSELCARCVQDILYLLDAATGPNGGDEIETPPDPETSRLYQEFRDWFGPNVGSTIQALVVGPLLSRLAVDLEGRAHIEDDVYRDYRAERGVLNKERMISRAKWLVCEIPLMIESYGELYEHEEVEALAQCKDVAEFDYANEDPSEFIEQMLPDLEQWFLFSQPGGRMLRGDQDASAAFAQSLEFARERVAELEAAQKEALVAESPTDDQKFIIEYEINKIESRVRKMEKALKRLNENREQLIERLYD